MKRSEIRDRAAFFPGTPSFVGLLGEHGVILALVGVS
jgi:hypothetical protein